MKNNSSYRNKFLLLLIFPCVIAGVFFTGLWPFNFFQKNTAEWVSEKSGISLKRYSMIHGKKEFEAELFDSMGATIELVIRPGRETYSGIQKILSFYNPEKKIEEFIVAQWISHLIIRKRNRESESEDAFTEKACRYLLPVDSTLFITFTTDGKKTAVYMNGNLKKIIRNFTFLTLSELSGTRLIIGNSLSGISSWTGRISLLRFYDTAFDRKIIEKHYSEWKLSDTSADLNSLVLCYKFDEGHGNVIEEQCGSGYDLYIPSRFKTLRKQVLTTPGVFSRKNRSHILDILLNILGYIPLGFFFALFIIEGGASSKRSVYISTVSAGFIISLIVELLQMFLPSRDSSMQDLVFNTVGTVGGVMLLHFSMLFERPSQVFGQRKKN